jgi:hypothetical protein
VVIIVNNNDKPVGPGVWLQVSGWSNTVLVLVNMPLICWTYLSGHGSNGPAHPHAPVPSLIVSAVFNFIWMTIGGIGLTGTHCDTEVPSLYACIAVTMAADTFTFVIAVICIVACMNH